MNHQRDQRDDSHNYRVPVEDPVIGSNQEVRPQRLKEVAIGVEGNAPHYVAQGRAEKDSKQDAGH